MWNSVSDAADHAWKKIRVGLRFHGKGTFPNFPIPVRLPFGAWWLAWNDVVGKSVLKGVFEKSESEFLMRMLRPGMNVLDIGAHHGFYTLLASRSLGDAGHVYAFEPSPRERKKLNWHLKWNHCSNVEVFDVALGASAGEAELFLAAGRETGCNGLRPPAVRGTPKKVNVTLDTVDNFLARRKIEHVDFVKLDVEGAELSVLGGAANLLSGRSRPILLVEICDLRTAAWGYPASRILDFLLVHGYQWFELNDGGWLSPALLERDNYDQNFIAVPEEKIEDMKKFMSPAKNEQSNISGG